MSDTIKIVYDEDRLTVDDLETITESPRPADIKRVLGRFVQNGNGEYLPDAEGAAAVGKLTLRQLKEVATTFAAQAGNTDPK